ncbi:BQ5605_C030g10828 [Microbotryum silenes-dioicae]|uniref:BQ5605_C030g10828 protein n=1 Tax=Microbotryum silenes-dioicae TaxID=796604 RepID=A0A2X0MKS0_9BASI|nr:BQ5605_C030g10828 [Microbotryum silenes-dioicae]
MTKRTRKSEKKVGAYELVDDHDTQPQKALESWIDPTFEPLAYALILFRDEIPKSAQM